MENANDMKKAGRRIMAMRIANGMTRAQLAEKVSRSEQTIASVEYGNKGMSIDTLCLICKALSVTPDYILGWSRYPEEKDEEYSRVCEEIAGLLKSCNYTQMRTVENIIKAFVDGTKKE